jgi:hypothetical protein
MYRVLYYYCIVLNDNSMYDITVSIIVNVRLKIVSKTVTGYTFSIIWCSLKRVVLSVRRNEVPT